MHLSLGVRVAPAQPSVAILKSVSALGLPTPTVAPLSFLSVMFSALLIDPAAVFGSVLDFGPLNDTAVPSPVSVSLGLLPLKGMSKGSLMLPTGLVGANATSTVHFFLDAKVVLEQVSPTIMKEAGAESCPIVVGSSPLLFRVSFFVLLVTVASTLPKFSLAGATAIVVGGTDNVNTAPPPYAPPAPVVP